MEIENILNVIVTWCGGIGVGVLIVFLVKDIINLVKGNGGTGGQGSIGSIVIKVLSVLLVLGFMYVATNYESWGKKTSDIGGAIIDTAVDTAGKMGGSGN